jgi:hypothetical protein
MMGKLFGGILGSLMSEEYLKQQGLDKAAEPTTEEVEVPASEPAVATKASPRATSYPVAPSTVAPSTGNEKTEMREKLYQAVVKLNKEGIDFFEL